MSALNIRKATAQDAKFVLEMSEMAGHGFLPHYFKQVLPEGRDLRGFMLSSVENPEGKMSYTKCLIAEVEGVCVGMINLDRIAENPEPIDPDLPPMFLPLAELEASVPGALIIEFLATLPETRGKGVGAALIDSAKSRAGSGGLALVVSDNNTTALGLYEKAGFLEVGKIDI